MIRSIRRLVSLLCVLTLACTAGCMQEAPISGRSQFSLVPDSQMTAMGLASYKDYMKEAKVVADGPQAAMVARVGHDIRQAVEAYFQANPHPDVAKRLRTFAWEFHLVDDKEPNAFAMPGGKVVVQTGILPITKDETGLAVVMGHEIAHAVAGHHGERMSRALLIQLGGVGLNVAMKDKPSKTKAVYNMLYGIGGNVGFLLPNSRVQEYEADRLGLIFMAMAGYDPAAGADVWARMSKEGKRRAPIFLSTHPTPESRLQVMREDVIPEAQKYYRK